MSVSIELFDLDYCYRDWKATAVPALEKLSLRLRGGVITALVGPNGSGKTTLAEIITGWRKAHGVTWISDAAAVAVNPYDNPTAMANSLLIRGVGDYGSSNSGMSTKEAVETMASRPGFDRDYFEELLEAFRVPKRRNTRRFSQGQRAAFTGALALASRTELTVLDELTGPMDALTRDEFFRQLLIDYDTHPRTVVISSHHVGELAGIVEDVVILNAARLVYAGGAEELRSCSGDLEQSFIQVIKSTSDSGEPVTPGTATSCVSSER